MWTINLLTGDIIEKCLLSTFMRVVLSVGEIQLGKNLLRLDWEKALYRSLFKLANTLKRLKHTGNLLRKKLRIKGVC